MYYCTFLKLSYSIISGSKIPGFVGVLLGLLALIVLTSHIYIFTRSKKNAENYGALRGVNFDPNDPEYKPIGGIPNGIGWVN